MPTLHHETLLWTTTLISTDTPPLPSSLVMFAVFTQDDTLGTLFKHTAQALWESNQKKRRPQACRMNNRYLYSNIRSCFLLKLVHYKYLLHVALDWFRCLRLGTECAPTGLMSYTFEIDDVFATEVQTRLSCNCLLYILHNVQYFTQTN